MGKKSRNMRFTEICLAERGIRKTRGGLLKKRLTSPLEERSPPEIRVCVKKAQNGNEEKGSWWCIGQGTKSTKKRKSEGGGNLPGQNADGGYKWDQREKKKHRRGGRKKEIAYPTRQSGRRRGNLEYLGGTYTGAKANWG